VEQLAAAEDEKVPLAQFAHAFVPAENCPTEHGIQDVPSSANPGTQVWQFE
jgi:hypothetical protein